MPKFSNEIKNNIIQIEQAILAIALNDSNSIYKIVNKLNGDDFVTNEDRIIFNVIKDLASHGASIDSLIVNNLIETNSEYDFPKVHEYLVELNSMFVHSLDLESYIEALINYSTSKKLITFGKQLIDMNLDLKNFDDSM